MPSERFELLVSDCLDGALGTAGTAEAEALAGEVERDKEAAGSFDKALSLEALLVAAHREPPDADKVLASMRSRLARTPAVRRAPWRVAAAAVLALAALVWLGLRGRTSVPSSAEAPNQVVAGSVLVSGVPAVRVPNGARVTVAGESPAVIRLADGSQATLNPGTVAVLHGPAGGVRQVVELERGAGSFRVTTDPEQFSVATPVGSVMVLGTEFSVELRPVEAKGGEQMNAKMAVALFVAVAAGTVHVDFQGHIATLSAGQSMAFGGEGKNEGEAGERRFVLSEGATTATITGVVQGRERGVLKVKVEDVQGKAEWKHPKEGGGQARAGDTLSLYTQWEKGEDGNWRPSRREVAILEKLRAGDRIVIGAYFDEHPRMRTIEVLEKAREHQEKERKKKD